MPPNDRNLLWRVRMVGSIASCRLNFAKADGSLYVVFDMQPVGDERITFLLYPPEQCKSTRTTNAHTAVGQLSRAPP